MGLAEKTWTNHRDRLLRLYEQGASEDVVKGYVKRWLVWVRSGVVIDMNAVLADQVGGFGLASSGRFSGPS